MKSVYPHFIGIDFGTTNTSAAYWCEESQMPKPFRFPVSNKDFDPLKLPSAVLYDKKDSPIVGLEALVVLDDAYKNKDSETIKKIVTSIKSSIKLNYSLYVGGAVISPQNIITDIIKYVKDCIESQALNGQVAQKVILTHPVHFSFEQQKILKNAARDAGFEEIKLLNEPEAAAYGYFYSNKSDANNVMIYDFGGGTFDLSFLTKTDDSYETNILPKGYLDCGGDSLDKALFEYFNGNCNKKLNIPLAEEKDRSKRKWANLHCKRFKENTSNRIRLNQNLSDFDYPHVKNGVGFTESLTKEGFNTILLPIVAKTKQLTQDMLQEAERKEIKVDEVVLVGGSSRLPLVKDMLTDILPIKPTETTESDILVALGAVIWGNDKLKTKITPELVKEPLSPEVKDFIKLYEEELKNNSFKEALLHIEKACFRAPTCIPVLLQRAEVLYQLEEYKEVIITTNRITSIEKNNDTGYFLRSKAYLKADNYNKAENDATNNLIILEENLKQNNNTQLLEDLLNKLFEGYLLKAEIEFVKKEDTKTSKLTLESAIKNEDFISNVTTDQKASIYCLLAAITFTSDNLKDCSGYLKSALSSIRKLDKRGGIVEVCKRFELDKMEYALGDFDLRSELQTLLLQCSIKLFSGINYNSVRHFKNHNSLEIINPKVWKEYPDFGLFYNKICIEEHHTVSIEILQKYFELSENGDIKSVKSAISYHKAQEGIKARLNSFFTPKIEIAWDLVFNTMTITNKSKFPIIDTEIEYSYDKEELKKTNTFKISKKILPQNSYQKDKPFQKKNRLFSGVSNIKINDVKNSEGKVQYELIN